MNRDYKKEYDSYHSKPENMKARIKRNLWNRRLKNIVPNGKEIDHKIPLASGGSNSINNINFRNISSNRSDKSMIKESAVGAVLGAWAADEGVENKLKGAVAGQTAGWVVTPPALLASAKILKETAKKNAKIGGKAVSSMSTAELTKKFFTHPKQSMKVLGKDKVLASTVLVPYAFGIPASLAAGKYYGRGNMDKKASANVHAVMDVAHLIRKMRNPNQQTTTTPLQQATTAPLQQNISPNQLYQDSVQKTASIEYRGETFDGYNKPKQAPPGDDHKMVVLAKQGDSVKLIRFGKRGYEHNYSKDAKQNYLTRSAGIRDKNGNLTKDNKLSANYWARKILWPKNQKADGTSTVSEKKASFDDYTHMNKYRAYKNLDTRNSEIFMNLL